ncbi:hypothetical protein CHLRE_04g222700v5 [Chlamydomonas reinhardtii]|jgi:elongation factor 3|uniref:Elongation factor 3 n=1 Tax=Chlamydomonas reinhardtii TaxID=3055 RepID=A8ISZ1_CHLRE|nr:uncharacterized protein CHLRE_04g222700v5 [Chlamydomonas reinhardtii]PNW84140.1 hypothetical protein CHLRE_04g222700v5 [Chlamydomonas reinhardtii]|eukprot:XP_001692287.1 elongation factor EF-3 [Chlamydomonas reinhardtii]
MSADADVNLVIRIEEVSSKIAELPESKASAEIIAKVASGDASAADALAAHLKKAGAKGFGATAALKAAIEDKANPAARQAGLAAYQAICDNIGSAAEPFLAPLLPAVLEQCGDKKPEVKAAAEAASKALISIINPHAVYTILGYLFECMDAKKHPATKEASLLLVKQLVGMHPKQITRALPDIVPAVSGCMNDSKQSVKDVATETMKEACTLVGNRDINAMVPLIIRSINHPEEVQETVHKLASTTFVQAVEAPALAMMVPLLLRGLRERVTAIKRKAAVVADNMAKLVDNPAEALVFLPRLMPEIEKVANEAADPELRKVSNSAIKTLQHIETEGKAKLAKTLDKGAALKTLHDLLAATAEGKKGLVPEAYPVLDYAAALCANLTNNKNFEIEEWRDKVIGTYLGVFVSKDTLAPIAQTLADKCFAEVQVKSTEYFDDEEGEELCNCEFSLAYGAKILLNNAALRLKRGRRYGLCGPNGVGKSTLMRAIANGQVDGFPPKDVLRTVYVEHDIDGSLSDLNCVEFVFADENLQAAVNTTKEQVTSMLSSVGFTEELLNKAVGSLSGGWKMKLALARTMLMKPDIMLLDEPTNHLDVHNVKWLEDYLVGLDEVSSIIVSHDSGFLDHVCTHIIDYNNRKLRVYKGNLSKFVEQKPEAKAYYELTASTLTFKLPEPGYLEGVKTKDKAILKADRVSYKYPNTDRMIFEGATAYCTLSSRVACIGPNGAGKSTLIKVLTGEVEPVAGTVWKHPNLRIAYVAQHAFHHLEKHLDKTPNEYIQWRFAPGEDREAQEKETRLTEEEQKKLQENKVQIGDDPKVKRSVEKLLARRKLKKSYEYEVQWANTAADQTSWLPRDTLVELGYEKLVNELDIKEAAALGLFTRPLTTASIQKHLEDLGLESEFALHSHIRGLSGGQKVKVVLAAATWQNPHLIVLDEPTNYLDRDSLGALAGAIKDFGGGIVVISHHNEFVSALCNERWIVGGGKMVREGDNLIAIKEKVEIKQQDEVIDAFGNTIKVKGPKKEKMSNKEKKALEKLRKARKERGEVVTDSEEEC